MKPQKARGKQTQAVSVLRKQPFSPKKQPLSKFKLKPGFFSTLSNPPPIYKLGSYKSSFVATKTITENSEDQIETMNTQPKERE